MLRRQWAEENQEHIRDRIGRRLLFGPPEPRTDYRTLTATEFE